MNNKIDRDFDLFDWDNLITLEEASRLYGRAIGTLTKNIKNGAFVEGIDCMKIGNSWVIDKRRLQEVYEGREFIYE